MTDVFAQVAFESSTNLAKDRVINTFNFSGTDSAASIASTFYPAISSFYNTAHTPGTTPICGFLSGDLVRGGSPHSVKWYNLADTKPRAPYRTDTLSLGSLSGSGVNLPKEVAACLSYKGTYASGIPQARQRGRLYIGPLNSNTILGSSTANPTLDTSFTAALRGGALYLISVGSTGSKWVVRSQKGGFSSYIVGGWTDNAFDSQRRRGLAATTRTTY